MKKEYAQKINALLECFHFNNEFMGQPFDHSLALLRHGISHLYFFVMCLGESDEETLTELRALIGRVCEGEVPKPYDLSGVNMQPDTGSRGNVVIGVKNPPIVYVELTPELIKDMTAALSKEGGLKSAQAVG